MDVSVQSGEATPDAAPVAAPETAPLPEPDEVGAAAAVEAAVDEGLDGTAASDAAIGMDVSAQTLRDVKFREKFRGYHPDDVDEFLEQVAEGITYLQGRLREAQESAGFDPSDPDAPIENNEALRRTLVLAQRTAELAVQEAHHEAERIQSQARQHADTIVSRAEEAARRTVEETNTRLRDEVAKLESARARLRPDVEELETYLETQRQQLHAALSAALTRVEEVLPPPTEPAPQPPQTEVPPVPWPEPVERAALWEPPDDLMSSPLAVADEADVDDEEPLTVAGDGFDDDDDDDDDDDEEHTSVGGADSRSIWSALSPATDDDAWASSVPSATLDDDDDDPFIAELRRAITDTTPLGPRDDVPPPSTGGLEHPQEQEVPGRRRFGRKRR